MGRNQDVTSSPFLRKMSFAARKKFGESNRILFPLEVHEDSPVGRISLVLQSYGGSPAYRTRPVRQHFRETWKLDGRRVRLETLLGLLARSLPAARSPHKGP